MLTHHQMREQLGQALTTTLQARAWAASGAGAGAAPNPTSSSPTPTPADAPEASLARALARALRVLFAQLKLLKLDAANARLQALASALQGTGAVAYLQAKFSTLFRLPPLTPPPGPGAEDQQGPQDAGGGGENPMWLYDACGLGAHVAL